MEMPEARPLIVAGCTAQLGGAAALAGFPAAGVGLGALLGAAFGVWLVRHALPRAPAVTAMLALGGLGMTLGWWADLGFQSAVAVAAHARAPLDPLWCRAPSSLGEWAGLPGLGHVLCWMNAGMLAFGLPAARLAHRDAAHGAAESVVCALAMIAGMTLGSRFAAGLAPALAPRAAVLLDHAAMLLGMGAGMAAADGLFGLRARLAAALRRRPALS